MTEPTRRTITSCHDCDYADRWGTRMGPSIYDLAANPLKRKNPSNCELAQREYTDDEYWSCFKDSIPEAPEWCPLRKAPLLIVLDSESRWK